MKNKILTLIIGMLLGAIIASAGFFIYNKIVVSNNLETMQVNRNGRMQMQDGEEPPEIPSGDNSVENSRSKLNSLNTNTNTNS